MPVEPIDDTRICVVGTGYVGLTLAAVLGQAGLSVVGIDRDEQVARQLQAGKTHFHEAGLEPLVRELVADGRLQVDTDIRVAADCSTFIIAVGTPIDASGNVDLAALTQAGTAIADVMPPDALVILRSTVKVGVTTGLMRSILEASGKPFDLAFCPERTVEGKALEELRQLPQIVGGATPRAAERAATLFSRITDTVLPVSSVGVAEVIKLVDNTARDIGFAVANEVARFCDRLGIDAIEVIRQGAHDYPRTLLSMPGPVGGPCLSKDPYIFFRSTDDPDAMPRLAVTARDVNRSVPAHAADAMLAWLNGKGVPLSGLRIGLLGMAFKGRPATDDIRGTTTLDVRDALQAALGDAAFVAWDPVVRPEAISALGIEAAQNVEEAFAGSTIVVIANNHPIWPSLDFPALAKHLRAPGVIYDLWNSFEGSPLQLPDAVGYIALGRHGYPVEGSNR